MNRDRRPSSSDPAADDTARESTGTAGGLLPGSDGPGVERNQDYYEEPVNRTRGNRTPRRYEQPLENDEDPVMPADDSTKTTKI